jgi:membrane-associated phospholipid phosphatase
MMFVVRSLLPCFLLCRAFAQDAGNAVQVPAAGEPAIGVKQIPSDVLQIQKRVWLFPAEVASGKHVPSTLLVLGSTAGLVAADPPVARYFRDNAGTYYGLNHRLSGTTTTAAVLAVPAMFYITGRLTKDTYTQNTGMMAAQAALAVEIPNLVLRNTTRRLRPLDAAETGNFSNTWFKTTGNPLTAKGSFPSGHSAAAFAVATVVAHRYREHRWVPFVAYGAATLVAFSRTSSNAHYLSDVGFGSFLGFAIAHWMVVPHFSTLEHR